MKRKTKAKYSAAASLDLLRHVTSERRIQSLLDRVEAGSAFAIGELAAYSNRRPVCVWVSG
jgi:hypothetical protein